jgi:hypothetical protein
MQSGGIVLELPVRRKPAKTAKTAYSSCIHTSNGPRIEPTMDEKQSKKMNIKNR